MELLLHDATVLTLDGAGAVASSLLVRDGRVVATGGVEDLARRAPAARRVAMGGATVMPGLIDAHCHPTIIGYLSGSADCRPAAIADIGSMQRALQSVATRGPRDRWVTGWGYVEWRLAEGRHPTRHDLDAAVPDRPCVVFHASLHACVLNSAALADSGIADERGDPPDGHFGREPDGRPDGTVYEAPVFALLRSNMDRDLRAAGDDERMAMAGRMSEYFAGLGVTTCVDAFTRREGYELLLAAEARGLPLVRFGGLVDRFEMGWIRGGLKAFQGTPRVRINGVKIFADGGMSSGTAAISGTYESGIGGSGIMLVEPDELSTLVQEFDGLGLQVAIHAQGDRAIAAVLDAFETVIGREGTNPRRHRIEHGGAFTGPLIVRASAMHVPVVSQPGFFSTLGDGFIASFGPARAQDLYPFRSMRRAGLVVAGSSDAPVIGASPWQGIRDAAQRRTRSGSVMGSGERLTVHEALEMYSKAAAFASHWETELGSLESGKWADLIVVDENPLDTSIEDLGDIRVLATMVAGEVVGPTSLEGLEGVRDS